MRRGPMDCPLRRGREQDGSVSPAGDPISFPLKEMGERNRQREPIPKAVPFGNPPHRPGGCGPLEIPRSLRRTGDSRCGGTGVWTGVTDCRSPLRGFAMTGFEKRNGACRSKLTGRPQIQIIPEGDCATSPEGRYFTRPWPHFTPRNGISRPQNGHFTRLILCINLISSPHPAPGPKARRACCRREAGGSPARSPAWRR